jgi:hypothetical protein
VANGAGEGIRTPDPLITNQMLYQLSYTGFQRRKILSRRSLYCKASPGPSPRLCGGGANEGNAASGPSISPMLKIRCSLPIRLTYQVGKGGLPPPSFPMLKIRCNLPI